MKNPHECYPPPRALKISHEAATAFHNLKAELNAWPAWLDTVSSSTAIELLCWYWQQVRREGTTEVNPLEFRAKTRRGRPQWRNVYRNSTKPSDHRIDPTDRLD